MATLVDTAAEGVPQCATDMPLGLDEEVVVPPLDELAGEHSTGRTRDVLEQARTKAGAMANPGSTGKVKQKMAHLATLICCVYLTGTFGHLALPPQYGLCAMKPIHDAHNAAVPAGPEWNGYLPMSSWTYVDDTYFREFVEYLQDDSSLAGGILRNS